MTKSQISDIRYYSDHTQEIEYYANDNLLGNCCSELAIFFISFIFIGPLLVIIGIIWIISVLVKSIYYFYKFLCVKNKSIQENFNVSLSFEESRWITETTASMIGVLFMEKQLELSELRKLILEKVINSESFHGKRQEISKRFRRIAQKTDLKWRWIEDCDFDLDNHVLLFSPKVMDLSDILVDINNDSYNLSHPFWKLYLINSDVCLNQENTNSCDMKINENKTNADKQNSTIILKIHPSITDGISLIKLLTEVINDETHSSKFFINNRRRKIILKTFNSIFYSIFIFIKSWLHKSPKQVLFENPEIDSEMLSSFSSKSNQFVFCHLSLEEITRLKLITRSTFGEISLSILSSALKYYHHVISKSVNNRDCSCLLTIDMSNNIKRLNEIQTINNDLTFCSIELPLSTEGMIPILWQLKQKMKTLKSSSNYLFLYLLPKFISVLFSTEISEKLMNSYNKNSKILFTSFTGIWNPIKLNENKAKNILFWFPLFGLLSISMSCFSYNDQFTICLRGKNSKFVDLELLISAIKYQVKHLVKLLENRRIPGEKSEISDFKTIKVNLQQNLSITNLTENQILTLLNDIQINMQNEKNHSQEEIEEMKIKFSLLFSALREKKKITDSFDEFDEDVEKPDYPVNRRLSLPSMSRVLKNSSKRLSFSKHDLRFTDNVVKISEDPEANIQ